MLLSCNFMLLSLCVCHMLACIKTTTIKADRPLTRDTLNASWLLTNIQFQWTGKCHSQLPLAELGKPSPNIDLLCTMVQTGKCKQFSLFDLDLWPWPTAPGWPRSRSTIMPKIKVKVKRFKQESVHRQTDGHTHGRYQTYYCPCQQCHTIAQGF